MLYPNCFRHIVDDQFASRCRGARAIAGSLLTLGLAAGLLGCGGQDRHQNQPPPGSGYPAQNPSPGMAGGNPYSQVGQGQGAWQAGGPQQMAANGSVMLMPSGPAQALQGGMAPGASNLCSTIRARAGVCPGEHLPSDKSCAEIEVCVDRLVRGDVASTIADCVRRYPCNPRDSIDEVCMKEAVGWWAPSPYGNRIRARCNQLSGSCGNNIREMCMILPFFQDGWLPRVERCVSLQECGKVDDCVEELLESVGCD